MKSSNEKIVLGIVTVIGILGIVALLFNAVSGDMTGEAISSLKISKKASSQSCTDSDGGQDYFVGGTAKVQSTSETDYCLEEETEGYPPGYLYETYCENNSVTHKIINCQEHGGLDCTKTASGDACREEPTTTSSSSSSVSVGGSSTSGSGSSGTGLNIG